MGYSSAVDMRNWLAEDQALRWHLQSNHYPPISEVFLPAAKEALGHARNAHRLPADPAANHPSRWRWYR